MGGFRLVKAVEYDGYSADAAEVWPGSERVFLAMEILFGCVFTLELFLKIVGLGRLFFYDVWNGIDTVIVVAWFIQTIGAATLPLKPMFLRLLRLARLLRLLKLVRTIKGFDALYIMTTAMKGSTTVLLWSALLLIIVQVMIAMTLQTLLEAYMTNDQDNADARREVFKFYGTFSRTMLTMFEITLGNWMPPCRALVENVGEGWMVFSLC